MLNFKKDDILRLKKEINYLENKQLKNNGEQNNKLNPAYKVFGFSDNAEFLNWCFEKKIVLPNVIGEKTAKKIRDVKKEEMVRYQLKMASAMKTMSFSELLENHQKGKVNATRDNKYYSYLEIFNKKEKRDKGLEKFINHVIEHINLFKKVNNKMFLEYSIEDYAQGLKKIYEYKDFWVRDYKEWEPTQYRNSWWNLLNLMSHLFEDYSMPKVMKTLFFNKENKDVGIELYLDLCMGKSAHKAFKNYAQRKKAPELTKKQVHKFMNSRHEHVFEIEYKKLFLEEHGVAKEFIKIATSGNWRCALSDLVMIKDFLLLVQKETLFDKSQVLPLWDYIVYIRREMNNENKQFVLKNRSIQKLLNDMHEWHNKLNKSKDSSYWNGSEVIRPYVYEDLEKSPDAYYIRELTTAKDLIEEGRKLSHCVASYAGSCKRGHCSIWSLYKDNFGSKKKLITLEVVGDLTLIQCRGKGNRLPNDSEWYHISNWLKENGLKRGV